MRNFALTLVILLVCPLSASALAYAQFGTATSVRPIPAGVRANISGNVNATATLEYAAGEEVTPDTAPTESAPQQSPAPTSHALAWFVAAGAILLVLLGALWIYKSNPAE